MTDFMQARRAMVERQIEGRGVSDPRLLEAMRAVPREAFVDTADADLAHADMPLAIGAGQTISQPYIVALMIEAASLQPSDRALEVGAGSGYAAAIMGRLVERVHAIERIPELARNAAERLRALGIANVEVRVGDGTLGWPDAAPFDAILVAAGAPAVPEALKRQLAPGGRLIIPVGTGDVQRLVRIRRGEDGRFEEEQIDAVRFVPLIGEQGWQDTKPATSPLGNDRIRKEAGQ